MRKVTRNETVSDKPTVSNVSEPVDGNKENGVHENSKSRDNPVAPARGIEIAT